MISIKRLEKKLGLPAEQWAGKCYRHRPRSVCPQRANRIMSAHKWKIKCYTNFFANHYRIPVWECKKCKLRVMRYGQIPPIRESVVLMSCRVQTEPGIKKIFSGAPYDVIGNYVVKDDCEEYLVVAVMHS